MTLQYDPLHPFPCIYFKHGAYHYVKKNKWTRIGTTLAEAAEFYESTRREPQSGKFPARIDEALKQHFASKPLAQSTKDQYEIAARVLKRKFAKFDSPAQVKGRHVAKLKRDGAADPNMTNRIVSLLRTLFSYWLEDELCDSNPCIGVKRYHEAKRERLISMAEWWAIHEHAGPRLRVIMKLAYLTGQRIGDVLKIHRRQLADDGIMFRQQKTKKPLTVAWNHDIRAAVAEALALHGRAQGMWLFIGRKGKHADYRTVLLQWHEACAAAGVTDAKPNDQRAQSLTSAKRQGKNATKLAGHATEAMTTRYLRGREGEVVEGPSLGQELDVGQKSQ